jgi:hypothetical protein
MKTYGLFVQDRETKIWNSQFEGKAKSRRAFVKANAEAIRPFRMGKVQFRIGAVVI